MANIQVKSKLKLTAFVPYTAALLYGEIIYLMVVMTIILGKTPAIITGMALALLLTIHIIRLARRARLSRAHHLIICTLHGSYALASTLSILSGTSAFEIFLCIYRFITGAFEISVLWLLTDTEVIDSIFSQKRPCSQ
jgi:energy-converting hydrogenase Eha subunit A